MKSPAFSMDPTQRGRQGAGTRRAPDADRVIGRPRLRDLLTLRGLLFAVLGVLALSVARAAAGAGHRAAAGCAASAGLALVKPTPVRGDHSGLLSESAVPDAERLPRTPLVRLPPRPAPARLQTLEALPVNMVSDPDLRSFLREADRLIAALDPATSYLGMLATQALRDESSQVASYCGERGNGRRAGRHQPDPRDIGTPRGRADAGASPAVDPDDQFGRTIWVCSTASRGSRRLRSAFNRPGKRGRWADSSRSLTRWSLAPSYAITSWCRRRSTVPSRRPAQSRVAARPQWRARRWPRAGGWRLARRRRRESRMRSRAVRAASPSARMTVSARSDVWAMT